MVTSKNWRERMSADMRLRDFRPKKQASYLLVVRRFLDHVGREPEAVPDEDEKCVELAAVCAPNTDCAGARAAP